MKVHLEPTPIPDAYIVKPDVFEDGRGFFMEVYRRDEYEAVGLPLHFVQVNHSRSARNVLRGIHFQWDPPMGKLMRVLHGTAFLVAVDIRKDSPALGKWHGVTLSGDERTLFWAPAGCARGFCVLSAHAEIEYLATGTYNAAGESGVRWNDPAIGIEWPVADPILSAKDQTAQSLDEWLRRPESDHFRYQT
jgi:dTDP-4-dehydrorhamnose 3,5-epimerase